jgi:acyl-CoA hydrolase
MTDLTPLRDALLQLGLEDLIPLPEILMTPEVHELGETYQHSEKISAALIELFQEGRIQVWAGSWNEEPAHITDELAETSLGDARSYSFDAESDGLKRVYFVNVDNIRA